MNDAVAIYDNPEDTAHVKREFVIFRSDDSSVYSVTGGKVNTIAKIDHMKVVIIEKDNVFYTYSNLGSTLIKKGDEIKLDQLIGYAAFDLDKYKPTVELYISDADKSYHAYKRKFYCTKR